MSERKTAEIKFRCTPSFKASAQAAADAAGESLTEYVEAAVIARQNQALDGTATVGIALEKLVEPNAPGYGVTPEATITTDATKAHGIVDFTPVWAACQCRPWEYCTHKARP